MKIVDIVVKDAVPVERVWIDTMCGSGTSFRVNRQSWEAGIRRHVIPHNPELVGVATKEQAEAMATITGLRYGIDILWMGLAEGRNDWKESKCCVTYGDMTPNVGVLVRNAGILGVDPQDYIRERSRANVTQLHGRLRVVRRSTPCKLVHVGFMHPNGWHAGNSVRIAPPPHRPKSERGPSDVLAALVESMGLRPTARALGVSLSSVQRWLDQGVPTEQMTKVMALSDNGSAE